MRVKRQSIFKIYMYIFFAEAVILFVSTVFACLFRENRSLVTLLGLGIACLLASLVLKISNKKIKLGDKVIHRAEGFRIFVSGWFLFIIITTIAYMLNEVSFVDGFFEASSGWTTTGSTVFVSGTLPKSLVFLKSFTSWCGGMLMLILLFTAFPLLKINDQWFAGAETKGANDDKIATRMKQTVKAIAALYAIITALCFVLLLPSGLGPFYSLLNTFTTVSTTGIVVPYEGYIFTAYMKLIICIFMLVASTNFIVYYNMTKHGIKPATKNFETRIYLILICIFAILITAGLMISGNYSNFFSVLGNSFTQTISSSSTTGNTVNGIDNWPSFCKTVLLIAMLIGGCSFSTASGLKISRIIVATKMIFQGIFKRIHPRSVRPLVVNKAIVSPQKAASISVYILLYLGVFTVAMVLMGFENQDVETTIFSVVASFTNTGSGFGLMSSGDFSIFSSFGKMVSSILMTCGRLEIYPVIILFSRSFWNARRTK